MKTQNIWILAILCHLVFPAMAQDDASEQPEEEFQFRFDFQAHTGLSVPLGKYRMLTSESDDRSAADYGVYTELMTSITPVPSSPWRVGVALGYMHHPFQVTLSKTQFELPVFEASSWNAFYLCAGIGIASNANRSKFFYNLDAGAGIAGYTGGNIRSGQIIRDTLEVRTWTYPVKAAGVIRAAGRFGYSVTPSLDLFAAVSIFYAVGVRDGMVKEEYFWVNGQNIPQFPTINEKTLFIENQTTIFTLNLGLGFRYKFYKDPAIIHYQFNLEENQ